MRVHAGVEVAGLSLSECQLVRSAATKYYMLPCAGVRLISGGRPMMFLSYRLNLNGLDRENYPAAALIYTIWIDHDG